MIVFLFHWFVKITGWLAYWIVFCPKYYYEDKKRQSRRIRGSAIVISNHASVWDVAILLFAFPLRTLRCAVAELMYQKNALMSLFLRLFGAIRVDRTSRDLSFLSTCERILSGGGVVEIYPEARIPQKGEERPLAFKPSAVLLALRSGAPVIPVCHRSPYFGKGRTKVMIGAPIDVRELYDDTLSEKENIIKITEGIRRRIIEFETELQK